MEQVDVLAVVGSCAPERMAFARRLAIATGRIFIAAGRLSASPDPLDEALALAPWAQEAGAVIEIPGSILATELVGTLAQQDAPTELSGVICVVDAAHLLRDLGRDDYIVRRPRVWREGASVRYTARAMLTVQQLEFASTIVLVNWDALETDELATVMALISHLSPQARVDLDDERRAIATDGVAYSVGQERPGWVTILNHEFAPQFTDERVSAGQYEQLRPLHPGRLQQFLDERLEPGEFGTVIRSAGFCRLATRPDISAQWDHIGSMISFDPLVSAAGDDEDASLLAIGQEIAIIGLDLDLEALGVALDEAALTDAELLAGREAWATFDDPFPAWNVSAERTD